jgi:hypothetical protein
MAQDKTEWFDLFAPDGSAVSVAGKDRAELLQKDRGYTKSKPRNPKVPAYMSEAAARDKELADLRAENERLKAGTGETPEFAEPQTTPAPKK